MTGLRLLWLGLLLSLSLAACTAGSSDTGDNGKSHGFYGSMTGGWTQLRPQ